jgi:hypothetical protein
MASIKVGIYEKDGVEYDGAVEYVLLAEDIPFDNTLNTFTSDNVQDAIEEAKQNAEGFPRAGIILVNNGTQGNNDWITYSNLTPDVKIVFPVNTKINEVTFGNRNDDVEFDLEVYKNGITSGDLITTWSFNTGSGVDYGYITDLDLTFNEGDWIRLKYIDQGTNTSDLVVTIWISRIP